MNNISLTHVPGVRLASGLEPQQKWPMANTMTKEANHQGPKLIEISPSFGNEGTLITVVVQALEPHIPVKLAFNNLMVDTKQLHSQGMTSLVATVPSFQQVQSTATNVPISICFFNKDIVTETWLISEFTYTYSMENTTQLQNLYNAASYQQYAYQLQQTHRDMLLSQQNRTPQDYSDSFYNTQGFANILGSTSQVTTPINVTPITTPTYTQPKQHTPRHRHANSNTVFGFKSTAHTPTTSVANYQPYPGLISRTNLDISGDLDSMAKNWTTEEWNQGRRLVQFFREQNSNKITTTFQPINGERATNNGNIVVSCIYWIERNDYFITSVDCIYLLECLMDIRFSVEEKNRIRRNLEGFRPLTVSKCKSESSEFFKLIMSFPNPKPRNIEKDVKVFPWKTLPYALKKIITKYTAYNNKSNVSTPTSVLPPTPALSTPQIDYNSSNHSTPHHLYDQTTSYFDQKPHAYHYHLQENQQHLSPLPETSSSTPLDSSS